MILPSKHLAQDRALLTVGARILPRLVQPKTVSALWEELSGKPAPGKKNSTLRYDAFVLALDLLFLMGAVQLEDGVLTRTRP
jgi:hypothetical protein